MKHWNIAVCDDDRVALNILTGAIVSAFSGHDIEAHVDVFETPKALLDKMKSVHYELIFLDIEMPDLDGITLGRQLRRTNNLIDIIYISNREDLVFDALRVNPRGFIRKSRFLQDVPGVISAYLDARPKEEKETLLIQNTSGIREVALDELMYIEGAGKIQYVHLADRDEPIPLHRRLQELEDELTEKGFFRIHKGYLVNYRFIRHIGDTEVTLNNTENIPLSRRKAQETRNWYMELMQSGGSLVL
ncbi:MAG: response regulator transcription factor [Clostridia bacterium]|nr:response regulator transcription factor [Clostridia bacterium]